VRYSPVRVFTKICIVTLVVVIDDEDDEMQKYIFNAS
jgi:hypothetical protein